jgi:hypothetical protein
MRSHRGEVVAVLGLGALALLFFWKIALTNRVLAGIDVFAYFYPYRDAVAEALRAGRLPLWNPYLFMGAPLLANSQAAALYPLHWPFLWLDAPRQVAWSIVLHVWLAAAGTFLFARRAMGLSLPAALVAGAALGLGGFLGAQAEHVNQLNASAWLPWLLLCVEGAARGGRWRWPALLAGGGVVGLLLLAGHTQAAYIVLVAAGAYGLLLGWGDLRQRRWLPAMRGLAAVGLAALLGSLLAAGQLLPTLELSRLSVRSGGLPYQEAASFSLRPGLIPKALLPPYAWEPPFSEYVAYVGLSALLLAALGAWVTARRRRPTGAVLVLAALGLFLALGAYNPAYYVLYKLVPGIALFRAPARWLLLYSMGAALLAGVGLEALRLRRRWQAGLLLLVLIELFLGSRRLAYNRPTAPAAYDSLRTAPSHLLANPGGEEPFRFLSLSDIRYDPGDMGDLQTLYGDCLDEGELYDLLVATKMKEVLAYNLPLRYRLSSVDGYDGGLLPTARYVTLERLFLDEDEIWPDGRLRQQLREVPESRLLSLLNVKYVMTDKTQDAWIDGVFYDLEHTVPLGEVQIADLPDMQATHLGIVSYLSGTMSLEDGAPVAHVVITGTQGSVVTATLRAGQDTAEGHYRPGSVAHSQARTGHTWRDDAGGSDYVAVVDLGRSLRPAAVSVRSLLPGTSFFLRGMSLVDSATGAHRTLQVHPAYELVHSGDVKIYRNLEVLPRAFVVHRARLEPDDEAALALLRDPAFDPAREVLLASGRELAGPEPETAPEVQILSYAAEELRIEARLAAPGYLLLTDSAYPGWTAEVDGREATIERADLSFRAVYLEEGHHLVTMRYRPASLRLGLGISLAGAVAWLLAFALALLKVGSAARRR